MKRTDVQDRIPKDLLQRIRLLTTQAELIDRDVEALARAFHEVEHEYEAIDTTLHPEDDRMDRDLMDACGYSYLRALMGAILTRTDKAVPDHYPPSALREHGLAGFGLDDR